MSGYGYHPGAPVPPAKKPKEAGLFRYNEPQEVDDNLRAFSAQGYRIISVFCGEGSWWIAVQQE